MNARADSLCTLEKILASAAQTVRRKGVRFADRSKATS